MKWESADGKTLDPFVARDDTGCGPIVLNHRLYLELGEQKVDVRYGRGFGYRVPHHVLCEEARADNKFFWRVEGVQMDWVEFNPISFCEGTGFAPTDLALMPTFGWRGQAVVGESGIVFIHKGYKKLLAKAEAAAHSVISNMYGS